MGTAVGQRLRRCGIVWFSFAEGRLGRLLFGRFFTGFGWREEGKMVIKGGLSCGRERLWEENLQPEAAVWFVKVVAVLGKQQAGEKKINQKEAVKKMGNNGVKKKCRI